MKKLVATITAVAMLASASVTGFAQTDEKQALQNTLGGTYLKNTVGKEITLSPDKPTAVSDAKLLLAQIEVIMETYSSHISTDSEYYGADTEYYNKIKTIVENCEGDYITDNDNEEMLNAFIGFSFLYAVVLDGLSEEELATDAINEASTYYNALEDSDLKTYMGILLEQAGNITDFSTDDTQALCADLLLAVSFAKMGMPFIVGDVDQNGKITALDALIIARNLAGLVEFDTFEEYLADVNSDSRVTSLDTLHLQRSISGF